MERRRALSLSWCSLFSGAKGPPAGPPAPLSACSTLLPTVHIHFWWAPLAPQTGMICLDVVMGVYDVMCLVGRSLPTVC